MNSAVRPKLAPTHLIPILSAAVIRRELIQLFGDVSERKTVTAQRGGLITQILTGEILDTLMLLSVWKLIRDILMGQVQMRERRYE